MATKWSVSTMTQYSCTFWLYTTYIIPQTEYTPCSQYVTGLLNHSFTPWSKAILEKLRVLQQVKKFPPFMTQMLLCSQQSPTGLYRLIYPVHSLATYFFKMYTLLYYQYQNIWSHCLSLIQFIPHYFHSLSSVLLVTHSIFVCINLLATDFFSNFSTPCI